MSEMSRKNERGGRGRGRLQRDGRYGNRNNRRGRDNGRGRGRGRAGRYSQSSHLLTNDGYPAAVWDSFNSSERAQVFQMREAREVREDNEKRKVAAMGRETPEAKHQREETTERGIGATMTRRDS